jgi:hypothetical protein
MLVRVNGRPVDPDRNCVMPLRRDGEANGSLTVVMPEGRAEVALLAQAGSLFSDPVFVSWNWRPPAPPPPVATTAPKARAGDRRRTGAAPVPGGRRRVRLRAQGVCARPRGQGRKRLCRRDGGAGRPAGHASVESRLLTDRRATRAAVLDALAWLQASAGPRDTAMLFIAGHGVNDDNGQYFFMGHDADRPAGRHRDQRVAAARQPGRHQGAAGAVVCRHHAGNGFSRRRGQPELGQQATR